MNQVTGKQRELLRRIASITEMIEGGQATLSLLKRERMQVITRLRLTGYRAPTKAQIDQG